MQVRKSILSGEIGLLEHLWGRSPFSVRRGAEAAQRADRGDTHTQTRKDFTQLRATRMRKTLLLLVWIDSSSCSGAQEATVSLELGVGGCLLGVLLLPTSHGPPFICSRGYPQVATQVRAKMATDCAHSAA